MKLLHAFDVVAREGETLCGDAVLAQVAGDRAMFAVIDALGHGEGAWRVAQRAMTCLQRLPRGADAATALDALNVGLHGTRGAVATICCVRGAEADLIGIGNVTCRSLNGSVPFVSRPGIVGARRTMHKGTLVTLSAGQRLVMHSDGVSHRFDLRTLSGMSPEEASAFILRNHRYPNDDSSVLVIDIKAGVETTP